ncbi:MAG: exodeoxyribonuclease VII small subunit [Chloroflexi bacterium]|nr:exodeoxyribonuclease VII small subunit [Chloroflexota bacterium]
MAKPEGAASFEEAYETLRHAIEELESGTLPLEAALTRYEEGMRLVQLCNDLLDRAELRVQRVGQELSSERSQPE